MIRLIYHPIKPNKLHLILWLLFIKMPCWLHGNGTNIILKLATILFTIDYSFTGKTVATRSSISYKQKTLKQLIMLIDFNIFPLSTLTDKHPITGQTYVS